MSFVAILSIFVVIYIYLKWRYSYWKKKGVNQDDTPMWTDWGTLLKKFSLADMVKTTYSKASNNRYFGTYQFFTPTLLIKDIELIKQLTIKDFDHFQDHRTFLPEETEPLWSKNLFSLKGQKWKQMRATLSPSFTSGKMRTMFSLISECAQNFANHFSNLHESDLKNLDMKDIFTRFTNDVIASIAFGIKCDSMTKRDNEFYVMGKQATNFKGLLTNLKIIIAALVPQLYKALQINLFSRDVSRFFRTLIKDAIIVREQKKIIRPDMLHLLMEARKNGIKYEEHHGTPDTGFAAVEESDIGKDTKAVQHQKLTDDDITAQALIFFLAGFESVSSLMCFMAYELSLNQDVQQKLIKEIDNTLHSSEYMITYEALLSMKYLDMVVSETLRKWPSTVAVDRIVTKPYTIEPQGLNEKSLHLRTGEVLWIPIYAIHHDPEYYPNPEKFDPERFSDDNKANIKPYTFIPFGVGPRNCIGSRFALLEAKAIFVHILSKFEIVVSEKTQIPLKLEKSFSALNAEGGIWLSLKKRLKC